jgi:hypothetical protein
MNYTLIFFINYIVLDDIQMPHGIDVYIKDHDCYDHVEKLYYIHVDLSQFAFIVVNTCQMKPRMKIATHIHNATNVRIKLKS